MIWFIIAVVVLFALWQFSKIQKKPNVFRRHGHIIERLSEKQMEPGITLRIESMSPDPDEWAREREAAKKAKQEAINHLVSSFTRPASIADAFAGMQMALSIYAAGYHAAAPDFERLWVDCQAGEQKKPNCELGRRSTKRTSSVLAPHN